MRSMRVDYKELISNAIEKDEVVKLLRGEGEYEVVVSEFASDVFPTDINSVLVNCFYKQNDNIRDIEKIFNNALTQYPHVHVYDNDGNLLDSLGNIVDRKSPDGHIPYKN